MTSRTTAYRRRRLGTEFINQGSLSGVLSTAHDGYMIKWSFPFLRANFHLIFRLSDYSHENAVANDHSPSKDYANNLNVLDQERDFFLNNVDDEEKVDAFDKPDVLDDLQVDSMIDENEEAEDEEFFDL